MEGRARRWMTAIATCVALGVIVRNGWAYQNPQFNGFTAISGYFPDRRIALALTTTRGPAAAATGVNYSERLFGEISRYLTPAHPPQPVG